MAGDNSKINHGARLVFDRASSHIWRALCADEDGGAAACRWSRTQGSRILLADGRELIDGVATWWTACHGYNHPHIRARGRRDSSRQCRM